MLLVTVKMNFFHRLHIISDLIKDTEHFIRSLDNLPDKAVIHINDTHPALCVPELMRLLVDEYDYGWDRAWEITCATLSYTNHTVMAEALERWPVSLFQEQLPRIYSICQEINRRLMEKLQRVYPNDPGKWNYMAVIANDEVRMANLCLTCCHKINGVSQLHTDILEKTIFRDYYNLDHSRFLNITNGIAYRRWLCQSNPALSGYLQTLIGDGFLKDANALEALEHYRACFKASRAAAKEVRRVEEASRAQGSRVEEARFALERIGEVDPKPGEYEELEELLPRSEHAEVLVATANDAHASLASEGGALDAVNSAVAELSRMATVDRKLGDIADALSDACISLEDCANELRSYRDGVAFDPRELARMRERYSDLKGLLRQWGPTMDDVFAMRDRSQELLSLVDDGDEQIKKAREALGSAERELFAAAKALKRARNTAAPRFCHEVGRQMARLEMGSAELVWESRDLPRAEWTSVGPSSYELLYRSGAGLTPRPLRRIASGGELSRVMLASKVVLGNADGVDTLVFDEVDAGVGGSTARALAGVLADLAATHQVIVVTHLAQVAVMADKHYVVSKEPGDVPQTHLDEVTGEARIAEIARMLSGDQSEASLAHAKQMLEEARG